MEQELRLLIVEDVAAEAELAVRQLKSVGLRCDWHRVETEGAFREALRDLRPELILFARPAAWAGADAEVRFTVGAADPCAVSEEELRMLREVVANLSFALQYLHK